MHTQASLAAFWSAAGCPAGLQSAYRDAFHGRFRWKVQNSYRFKTIAKPTNGLQPKSPADIPVIQQDVDNDEWMLPMRFPLNVNRGFYEADVQSGTPLLTVLRDDLALTGTRFGCGQGVCGACYVLADGRPVPSCMMSVEDAVGKNIVTVEGLASGATLHPVQRAFLEEDAMQCGYCISGMLISAAALLAQTPQPTDAEIRDALGPHLCRCGVYLRAIRAVKRAAQ